jgi:HAE1 family hydrophobic/amphiphilic exporter-1
MSPSGSAEELSDGPTGPRHPHGADPLAGGHGTALFIRRPILAFVLNALIVIAGLAGFLGADVRELPDVDRPVVSVSTAYRRGGAGNHRPRGDSGDRGRGGPDCRGEVDLVLVALRLQPVTVEFRDDVDLDVAATDLRDAVARVAMPCPTTPMRRAWSNPMPIPMRSCASPSPRRAARPMS